MSRKNSTMLPIGTSLPAFDLPVVKMAKDLSEAQYENTKRIRNSSLGSKPALFMVICAHCPFVKHIEKQLTQLDQDYGNQVQIIAISSNSLLTHPQDGPDQLANQAQINSWTFPYLLDLEQNLAKALRAACTPDFFLFSEDFNGQQRLQYRGQLDDSRPGNEIPVTGKDLRRAIDAVLIGEKPSEDQKPSIGCNIKWHPGKEPDWF